MANMELGSTKVRISKKFLAALPAEVAERVKFLADDYRIPSTTFKKVSEGYKFYGGEGYRYTVVLGERASSVEMVSEVNLGASGVSHSIGAEFTVPVGGWVICISYYCRYWMTVYNVQPAQVEA